jgi:hypothetical protein
MRYYSLMLHGVLEFFFYLLETGDLFSPKKVVMKIKFGAVFHRRAYIHLNRDYRQFCLGICQYQSQTQDIWILSHFLIWGIWVCEV